MKEPPLPLLCNRSTNLPNPPPPPGSVQPSPPQGASLTHLRVLPLPIFSLGGSQVICSQNSVFHLSFQSKVFWRQLTESQIKLFWENQWEYVDSHITKSAGLWTASGTAGSRHLNYVIRNLCPSTGFLSYVLASFLGSLSTHGRKRTLRSSTLQLSKPSRKKMLYSPEV